MCLFETQNIHVEQKTKLKIRKKAKKHDLKVKTRHETKETKMIDENKHWNLNFLMLFISRNKCKEETKRKRTTKKQKERQEERKKEEKKRETDKEKVEKGEAKKGQGETKGDTQKQTRMPILGGKTGFSIKSRERKGGKKYKNP